MFAVLYMYFLVGKNAILGNPPKWKTKFWEVTARDSVVGILFEYEIP